MKHSIYAATLAAALSFAGSAQAVVVTEWNFNSATPDNNTATGSSLPSIGAGTASLLGGVTATFASGAASGGSSDPAATDNSGWQTTTYAAQGAGNKTRGVEFKVSTLGWHGVSVEWDTRHSNTAARHQQFQYSTDGLNFVDFGAPFVATAGDTWFNNRSIDLSSITAVDNNPNFAFRMVAAFAPSTSAYAASNPSSSYGASGTWRFDMVTVNAAPIPEAETYAMMLAGLGLVGLMAARRRKV